MTRQTIQAGQIKIDFLLESADTGGASAMFEFSVPPAAMVPIPHSHEHYDETIYGLKGIMTFTVEGKVIHIGSGDICFIPRGAVHGFTNRGEEEAKALAVITPGLLGPIFFKEMAAIIKPGSKPDLEQMKKIMAKHGLVPALPAASHS